MLNGEGECGEGERGEGGSGNMNGVAAGSWTDGVYAYSYGGLGRSHHGGGAQ